MEDKTINRPEKAFLTGQHVEQTYGGCGQCVLYSLIENGFDISKDVFRSSTDSKQNMAPSSAGGSRKSCTAKATA